MASEQIISARVTQEFFDRYGQFVTGQFGDARGARSVALLDAMNSQMLGGVCSVSQCHADQSMLIKALEARVEALETKLETECIRLAGCGVAAMQNTEETIKLRLPVDSPYYSASYGDVCRAVDREMSLRSEIETLRNRPERIPTPKKKRPFIPLSAHHKARLQVLRCLGLSLQDGKTSSELAHQTGQNTNNVAKRLAELCHEGYVAFTGEYRLSRDSNKRLALWRCTDKQLPKAGDKL